MDELLAVFFRFYGLEQIGETYYGIERCTYLMTHIGDEHTLLMPGVVGTFCFPFQFFLCIPQTGDVVYQTETCCHISLSVQFRKNSDDIVMYLIIIRKKSSDRK